MSTFTGTWEGYKSWLGQNCLTQGVEFVYRGQSNDQWTLTSSWHRATRDPKLATYWQILPAVHDYVNTFTQKRWNLQDYNELTSFLGFLQHHGFPTPLLDWTRSPYIAAYFAFEGVNDRAPEADNIVLFTFDFNSFLRDWRQEYDLQSVNPFVTVLPAWSMGNQRQIIHQGLYTLSSVADQRAHIIGLGAQFQAMHGTAKDYLWEYRIPVSEKPRVMRDLQLMGISAMSLFPGVDGICRHLRAMYFSADVIGNTPSERQRQFMELLGKAASGEKPALG